MWMKNGPHSDITKFYKIIKYIKKEVTWASNREKKKEIH